MADESHGARRVVGTVRVWAHRSDRRLPISGRLGFAFRAREHDRHIGEQLQSREPRAEYFGASVVNDELEAVPVHIDLAGCPVHELPFDDHHSLSTKGMLCRIRINGETEYLGRILQPKAWVRSSVGFGLTLFLPTGWCWEERNPPRSQARAFLPSESSARPRAAATSRRQSRRRPRCSRSCWTCQTGKTAKA